MSIFSNTTTYPSHLQVRQSVLTWKIDRFSEQCKNTGQSIVSTIFEFGDLNSMQASGKQWQLRLYPFGAKQQDEVYLSVFLNCVSNNNMPMIQPVQLEYDLNIDILDITGNRVSVQNITIADLKVCNTPWGFSKFMKRSDLFRKKNTLLKDDTLTILVSLKDHLHSGNNINIGPSLINQYSSLLGSGEFSDVTIVIQGKEIKAHKCILSSKSKVFAAMFKHAMEESHTNIIKIDDIDYDIMKHFLRYVYCGLVPLSMQSPRSLLAVADKYEVIGLKHTCERRLWDDITVDNACEILRTADLYNCKDLKSDTITYIVTNVKEVLLTKSFNELSNSNQTLLREILIELVRQRID